MRSKPGATPAVLKASYRALMQKLRVHPDLGGDAWNAQVLNEAYATLRTAGFERVERLRGWIDWGNGDIEIWRRGA